MKFIFFAGGFAGFLLTATAGLLADRPLDLVLRDASIGCLAGAVLFRWFWSVVVKAIDETLSARRAAADAAAESEAAERAAPVTPLKTR